MSNAAFARMDAEQLELPDASFDVVLCALGLMYMPDPARAMREMRRVLRPGGRIAVIVWGDRSLCGWSPLFSIVDAEVESEVCPLFFRLGENDTLAELCADAGFDIVRQRRIATTLEYADADEACRAAFVGGPVALAWSRFDEDVRARVRRCYVESLEPWRHDRGYRVPGEFVIVEATQRGAQGIRLSIGRAHAARAAKACRAKESRRLNPADCPGRGNGGSIPDDVDGQLQLVLDNMPGALVYTDSESANRRLQRPLQGDVQGAAGVAAARQSLSPIFCGIWRKTATTARATSMRWSRSAWRACAILRG